MKQKSWLVGLIVVDQNQHWLHCKPFNGGFFLQKFIRDARCLDSKNNFNIYVFKRPPVKKEALKMAEKKFLVFKRPLEVLRGFEVMNKTNPLFLPIFVATKKRNVAKFHIFFLWFFSYLKATTLWLVFVEL